MDLRGASLVSESLAGESISGAVWVSSRSTCPPAGRSFSGTFWVAGVEIALGMTGGGGGKHTGCAGGASSDDESVSLLIADGW